MNNLTPGCKAIIIKAEVKENLGKVVTCLRSTTILKEIYWEIQFAGTVRLVTFGGKPTKGETALAPSSWLMWIDDPDLDEETPYNKIKDLDEVE